MEIQIPKFRGDGKYSSKEYKNEEDVEKMLNGMKRILECPVCLEIVRPPVTQCNTGHIYCGQCRDTLAECSICIGPFIATISRAVAELLDFLPKHCPYADKGCRAITLLDNHTQYCEYRSIKCRVGENQSCTWSGPINEWEEHSNTTHDSSASYTVNKLKSLKIPYFLDDWQSQGYYHKIDEERFLFYVWKEGNKCYLTLKHIEFKKPKQEYFLQIIFESENNLLYKSLIKSTPLRENGSVETNATVFLLKELNNIINGGRDLEVKVQALFEDLPENI